VLVVRNRLSLDVRQFNKSSLKILYRDVQKVIRDARQSFKKAPEYHETVSYCQTEVLHIKKITVVYHSCFFSVRDPLHFGTDSDPDPRIRTFD
jgi:hypothetical protein